jgi:hypothetical protein
MPSRWLAAAGQAGRTLRPVVRESWERSIQRQLDPELLLASLDIAESDLADYRAGHPLATVLPVIRRLLVRDADDDSGILVAVGDASGRLLWVDGDRALRRKAEGMLFVEGAGWSESSVGTSAPGTALELDHAVQIAGNEHFNRNVHAWSCTAVPVHDPQTHQILGVIDITGGQRAVDPHTLPLMEATAAAVESELMIQRLVAERDRGTVGPLGETGSGGAGAAIGRPSAPVKRRRVIIPGFGHGSGLSPAPSRPARAGAAGSSTAGSGAGLGGRATKTHHATLRILGRDTGELSFGDLTVELSQRHTEIIALLSWHREGLSAGRLAELVYHGDESAVTLRAEMVRLRRVLSRQWPELAPESRPYRLPIPIELDAQHVIALLDRGAHRVALATLVGAAIPASRAPGIEDIRTELHSRMRDALVTDGAADVLLEYSQSVEARDDSEILRTLLVILPPKSPRRAGIVARLEQLERD